MPEETLLDIAKNPKPQNNFRLENKTFNQPNEYSSSAVNQNPIPEHKKSKWWIVIVVLIILALLGGGYFYYIKYLSVTGSFNNAEQNYIKGPSNLSIEQSDTSGYFSYNYPLNSLIYQKTNNSQILANQFSFDQKEYSMLETYGGELISVSPYDNYSNYAVIYYKEAPEIQDTDSESAKKIKQSLKDAANNYYVVNLKTNDLYCLGSELGNFNWSPDNLFFVKNGLELWTYNIKMANYTGAWDPSIKIYYKIIDFSYQILNMSAKPNSSLLYITANPTNSESDFVLSTYDITNNKFNKIFDTKNYVINFSFDGKYYALINPIGGFGVYESANNNKIADVSDIISPLKLAWTSDGFYYFSENNEYFSKLPTDYINEYYFNIKKYTLSNSTSTIIFDGVSNNLAGMENFTYNGADKLMWFRTDQTANIYKLELK